MCRAVESLEYEPEEIVVFGAMSGKNWGKSVENDTETAQAKVS
jgi:hypothetical protein